MRACKGHAQAKTHDQAIAFRSDGSRFRRLLWPPLFATGKRIDKENSEPLAVASSCPWLSGRVVRTDDSLNDKFAPTLERGLADCPVYLPRPCGGAARSREKLGEGEARRWTARKIRRVQAVSGIEAALACFGLLR